MPNNYKQQADSIREQSIINIQEAVTFETFNIQKIRHFTSFSSHFVRFIFFQIHRCFFWLWYLKKKSNHFFYVNSTHKKQNIHFSFAANDAHFQCKKWNQKEINNDDFCFLIAAARQSIFVHISDVFICMINN